MSASLFAPEDVQSTLDTRSVSQKERLLGTYAQLLFDDPPVKSLSPDVMPDPDERKRLARRLAGKDVPRLLTAIHRAGLEISNAGRVADLKATLADWLRDYMEGCTNGGNPTETNIEELVDRTRQILGG